MQLRRHAEAAAEFARCIELDGRLPRTLAGVAAAAGNVADARVLLAEIEEMSGRRYVSAYFVAVILLALGDRVRALEALERAQAERAHWLAFILVDPALATLRGEPRFEQIVKRVGVPA